MAQSTDMGGCNVAFPSTMWTPALGTKDRSAGDFREEIA